MPSHLRNLNFEDNYHKDLFKVHSKLIERKQKLEVKVQGKIIEVKDLIADGPND